MNIKHIRIMWGEREDVTHVILADLLVSLGLCSGRDGGYLCQHVRRLGDALIHSDSVIATVKKQPAQPHPHTSEARDADSLRANQ